MIDMTTSMIRLVPERMHSALSDMLFQRAIEIVCICIAESQETPEICKSLDRLLLACSSCACFSISQRIEILDSARGTLTAVTQMKQVVTPMPASLAPLVYPANILPLAQTLPMKQTDIGNGLLGFVWQGNQVSRSPNEATIIQQQASLDALANLRPPLSWPQSSAFPEQGMAPPLPSKSYPGHGMSNLASTSTPSRQRPVYHHSPPIDASHREQAFQTLLHYGISPSTNSAAFEKMVEQLAYALAKQQVKT